MKSVYNLPSALPAEAFPSFGVGSNPSRVWNCGRQEIGIPCAAAVCYSSHTTSRKQPHQVPIRIVATAPLIPRYKILSPNAVGLVRNKPSSVLYFPFSMLDSIPRCPHRFLYLFTQARILAVDNYTPCASPNEIICKHLPQEGRG